MESNEIPSHPPFIFIFNSPKFFVVSVTFLWFHPKNILWGTLGLAHHGRASLPVLDNSMPHARPYLLRVGGRGEAWAYGPGGGLGMVEVGSLRIWLGASEHLSWGIKGEWDDSFETKIQWCSNVGMGQNLLIIAILWGIKNIRFQQLFNKVP